MKVTKFKALFSEIGTDNSHWGYFGLDGNSIYLDYPENKCKYCQMSNWFEYTGLKDKNGKEIYEGDILRHTAKYYRIIKTVKWRQKPNSGSGVGFNIGKGSCYEIIGNIYENPELAKE